MLSPTEKFRVWLMKPRGEFVYHKGYLPLDRSHLFAGLTRIVKEPVNTLANMAYDAAQENKVYLVQRKLSQGCYEYIAQGDKQ